MAEYLHRESGKDDIEVISSDDDDDDVDVGNAEVEMEVHEITTCEALTLLGKLFNLKELNKDERASLSSIKDRLEIIRVKKNKQRPMKDFFKQRNILLEISFLLLFLIFVDLDILLERQCYLALNLHHFSLFII